MGLSKTSLVVWVEGDGWWRSVSFVLCGVDVWLGCDCVDCCHLMTLFAVSASHTDTTDKKQTKERERQRSDHSPHQQRETCLRHLKRKKTHTLTRSLTHSHFPCLHREEESGWAKERETGGRGVRQREREKSTRCVSTLSKNEMVARKQVADSARSVGQTKKKKDTRVSPLSDGLLILCGVCWCCWETKTEREKTGCCSLGSFQIDHCSSLSFEREEQ